MNKLTWKWILLYAGVYSLIFYPTIMLDGYFSMEHISLGNPDPMYFVFWGVTITICGFHMSIGVLQEKSTEIASETASVCVSSLKPVAVIDPLDYMRLKNGDPLPETIKAEWRRKVRDSYKYPKYMDGEDIKKVCDGNGWKNNGPEIMNYLREYMNAVDYMKPVGLYPDGGVRQLGFHGWRWMIAGTGLLAVPPEYVIPHGDAGVCVSATENFQDVEQLEKIPPWLMAGIKDTFIQFRPGKHVIAFGNRPHWKCVRARVEANKDSTDDELLEKPHYIWTLGLRIKKVNLTAREAHLETLGTKLNDEWTDLQRQLDKWEEREQKKEPPEETKSEEAENGDTRRT